MQRSDTPGAPGAGLGLAIARRFTELQGGRIWVDPANSDGSGARFSVELDAPPAALGGAEAAPEVYASVAPQTTVPPSAS